MILAVSVVVHAAILYFGFDRSPKRDYVGGDTLVTQAKTATSKTAKKPLAMNPTCAADVLLAAGARTGVCLTTVGGEPLSCLGRVKQKLSLDLLACNINDEKPPPAVALLDTKTPLEKIKPMALLPLLKQAKQRAFKKKQAKKIAKKLAVLKKRELKKAPAGQIVEITKPDVQLAPKKTHRVSEFNSRVKEETVARSTTEKMVARPGPKELKSAEKATKEVKKVKADKDALKGEANDPKVVAKEDNDPLRSKTVVGKEIKKPSGMLSMREPRKLAEKRKTIPGLKTGALGKVSPNGIVPKKGNGPRRVAARTIDPARKGVETTGKAGERRRVPNLRPTKELLRRVVGGGSVDKLDGIKKGEVTALNARRWKFATFFNRLKRQVAQNWHPAQVYLRRDPQGNVYGTKDRLTGLRVTLNKDGSIKRIIIQRPSGVGFLDDEAERAFRAAGPFPNPPVALLTAKKTITFNFGFSFEIGSRRERWRLFRYR